MAQSDFEFMDKFLTNEDQAQTETLKLQLELDSKVEKLLDSLNTCPHFHSYNDEFLNIELNDFSSVLDDLQDCLSDLENGLQVFNSVVKPKKQ